MDINSLVGFALVGFRFSKSSYDFEFVGILNEQNRVFKVSTSYYLSAISSDLVDAESDCSTLIWPCLESNLQRVIVDPSKLLVKFQFESGSGFTVWGDSPLVDNLLIVNDPESGEWFTAV